MSVRSIPKKDSDLQTIDEISIRIESISRQINKIDSVMNPRDWDKHNQKAIKLNQRRDILWAKRAKMIRQEATA